MESLRAEMDGWKDRLLVVYRTEFEGRWIGCLLGVREVDVGSGWMSSGLAVE